MKKFLGVLAATVLVCGVAVGPAGAADAPAPTYTYDLETLTTTDPDARALLAEFDAAVPGWREAVARLRSGSSMADPVDAMVEATLNQSAAACEPGSFSDFIALSIADVDPAVLFTLTALGAMNASRLDGWLFGTEDDPNYALPGDAKALGKAFTKAERFWPAQSDEIRFLGIHGELFQDRDRIIRLVEVALGLPPAAAAAYADGAMALVASQPALRGGDNPIFTLNAYAPTSDDPSAPAYAAGAGDAILIGEGLVDWMAWDGIDPKLLQSAVAHEYGHHVQYEAGLFDSIPPSPLENRRLELMADALGAYFGAHRTGLNERGEPLESWHRMMFEIGSCDGDDLDYHGTPDQRWASSDWGADLALDIQSQGHQLQVADLMTQFDAALPMLLAAEAP